MAIVTTDDKHYKDIADSIRYGGEVANDESIQKKKLKPSEMAVANRGVMEKCYYYGYDEGHRDGRLLGIEQGKQAEYDAFWDAYQQNGNRTQYDSAFAGVGWTLNLFKPKYPLTNISKANNMFNLFRPKADFDLVQYFEDNGIQFDLSMCTSVTHMFSESYISHFPEMNLTMVSTLWPFGASSSVKTIDKIILKSDGSTTFQNPFQAMNHLENVVFEGTIGQNGLSFQWSTRLSKASITSIINALSTTTSGLAVTLSQTAVNNAFTSDEWSALIATKQNWTISLV